MSTKFDHYDYLYRGICIIYRIETLWLQNVKAFNFFFFLSDSGWRFRGWQIKSHTALYQKRI